MTKDKQTIEETKEKFGDYAGLALIFREVLFECWLDGNLYGRKNKDIDAPTIKLLDLRRDNLIKDTQDRCVFNTKVQAECEKYLDEFAKWATRGVDESYTPAQLLRRDVARFKKEQRKYENR